MNMKQMSAVILLALASNYVLAVPSNPAELRAEREHVIHQYILDLGNADLQDIASLFTEEGAVISTSRGTVSAQEFFNSFLPEIETASTVFHQSFISNEDTNHYAARFNFNFKLHDGEMGNGEYIDEFVFAPNSIKLTHVYMFENLKFN